MRKLWLVVLAVVPAFVPGCGCSSNNPCVPDPNSSGACPPIEGTYSVLFGSETDSNGCMNQMASTFEAQPSTILLSRQGATLSSTINTVSLQGEVFDDFEFTLHGNGGTDFNPDGGADTGHEIDFNIRGRFVPGANDGGTITDGTWETTAVDTDCDRQSTFTGTKTGP
jgi:hypothetical protein